jgi:hypothetical protein
MKYLKTIIILALMPLFLFLSACGNSDSSHTGSWGKAAQLTDDAVSRYPQLAADGNGNIIAVWAQSSGFYANRYDVVNGWGTPQKIGDTNPGWSDLHLAVSSSGHAIVAWLLSDQRFSHLQVVRYTAGIGWGPVETLLGIGEPKDTAIDDSGNAFIVAERLIITMSGEIRQLIIARSDQESGWRYDRIEYAETSTSNGFPKISVDGSGNGFIMWVEGFNDDYKEYVSSLSPAGIGAPQQIASLPGSSAAWTNIVVDDSGNAMALWGQADSALTFHTYACCYNPADGWGVAERIDNSPFDTVDQSLFVDPSGNFHAIWTQLTGSTLSDIYSRRYTPSGGWQFPLRVGTGGIARYPRIAADASGNLFAAWLQYDPTVRFGGDGKVYANHYQRGSSWGMQKQLTDALGDADAPALVADRSGKAMVMWSQNTGSVGGLVEHGIFFSRFE